jgi:hypothetical protein
MNDAKFEAVAAPLLDIKRLLRWQAASLAQEFPTTNHPKDEGGTTFATSNRFTRRHSLRLPGQGRELTTLHHIPQEFIILRDL